jgi:outer membrane protein OmpA-like peptidoglycan-associated protein
VDPNYFPESARFIQPYFGVGIGFAQLALQDARPREPNRNQNQEQTSYLESDISKSGGNLAYQGIVGAAFAIDSVLPGLAITAEYRYFGMLGAPLTARVFQVNANPGQAVQRRTASTDSFRPALSASSILVGLRYAFDAAEAAAPVANLPVGWSAPAPAPAARTYMVFFANNSAALDAAARQVVAEAVQSARTVPTTAIQLMGHADGTGRGPLNQQLSNDRVRNVTAELVRLGVPRNAIAGTGTGAAGSSGADPQARRVDIVLR